MCSIQTEEPLQFHHGRMTFRFYSRMNGANEQMKKPRYENLKDHMKCRYV